MVEYPSPCRCSDTPQLSCHTMKDGETGSLIEGHPPYNIHSPRAHFGVTAHDGDTCGEGAIDAEHNGLSATGHHGQVCLGIAVVPSAKAELVAQHQPCSSAKRARGETEATPHLTTMRTG